MTFRIDRARAAVSARAVRADNDDADEAPVEVQRANLPVPVGSATTPPRGDRRGGAAAFAAQLLGQDGQKRGLRGGEPVLQAARQTYSRVEWSGSRDRRARAGRQARTSV